MTTVAWVNYDHDAINRGYWDQGLYELLFAGKLWKPVGWHDFEHVDSFEGIPLRQGAVVVLPARYHVEYVEKLQYQLDQLPWVLLLIVGDEESLFPWERLEHPRMKMWLQTPRPDLPDFPGRLIPLGYKEECPSVLAECSEERLHKPLTWFFSGQITHERRQECALVARRLPEGLLNETEGFTQGYEYPDYMRHMAEAKVAFAPSGPATPDTFRLYEALEAGCVPIVDANSPGKPHGYWKRLFGDAPFPVAESWGDASQYIAWVMSDWPVKANEVFAWWQDYKRQLAYALVEDINYLKGHR